MIKAPIHIRIVKNIFIACCFISAIMFYGFRAIELLSLTNISFTISKIALNFNPVNIFSALIQAFREPFSVKNFIETSNSYSMLLIVGFVNGWYKYKEYEHRTASLKKLQSSENDVGDVMVAQEDCKIVNPVEVKNIYEIFKQTKKEKLRFYHKFKIKMNAEYLQMSASDQQIISFHSLKQSNVKNPKLYNLSLYRVIKAILYQASDYDYTDEELKKKDEDNKIYLKEVENNFLIIIKSIINKTSKDEKNLNNDFIKDIISKLEIGKAESGKALKSDDLLMKLKAAITESNALNQQKNYSDSVDPIFLLAMLGDELSETLHEISDSFNVKASYIDAIDRNNPILIDMIALTLKNFNQCYPGVIFKPCKDKSEEEIAFDTINAIHDKYHNDKSFLIRFLQNCNFYFYNSIISFVKLTIKYMELGGEALAYVCAKSVFFNNKISKKMHELPVKFVTNVFFPSMYLAAKIKKYKLVDISINVLKRIFASKTFIVDSKLSVILINLLWNGFEVSTRGIQIVKNDLESYLSKNSWNQFFNIFSELGKRNLLFFTFNFITISFSGVIKALSDVLDNYYRPEKSESSNEVIQLEISFFSKVYWQIAWENLKFDFWTSYYIGLSKLKKTLDHFNDDEITKNVNGEIVKSRSLNNSHNFRDFEKFSEKDKISLMENNLKLSDDEPGIAAELGHRPYKADRPFDVLYHKFYRLIAPKIPFLKPKVETIYTEKERRGNSCEDSKKKVIRINVLDKIFTFIDSINAVFAQRLFCFSYFVPMFIFNKMNMVAAPKYDYSVGHIEVEPTDIPVGDAYRLLIGKHPKSGIAMTQHP